MAWSSTAIRSMQLFTQRNKRFDAANGGQRPRTGQVKSAKCKEVRGPSRQRTDPLTVN